MSHMIATGEPLEVALDEARRRGADEAEVSWAGLTGTFARFASSRFNQVGESREHVVRVRVLVEHRLGVAMAASLAPDALARAAELAVAVARRAPRLGVELRFAGPDGGGAGTGAEAGVEAGAEAGAGAGAETETETGTEFETETEPETEIAIDATAEATLDLARLRRGFDQSRGAALFGALKRQDREVAVLTSRGAARRHAERAVQLQVIAQAGDGSGWAGWYGRDPSGLDADGVIGRATEIALRARGPVEIPDGRYDVVLAPAAVAALVEWMAIGSFSGRALLDGTSLLAGRAGEQVCSSRVTVREAVLPGEAPFDAEGTLRQPLDFIRAGRAGRPVTDLVTAARLGDRGSTGHAAPLSRQAIPSDPSPLHTVLEPGPLAEADLVAMTDRGLYVSRLHYVNGLLDTRRATMTGMTRDGTFLIEGGAVGRPVKNLRFTDSILAALAEDRLGGIGRELATHPAWYGSGDGVITCPALLLRGVPLAGAR